MTAKMKEKRTKMFFSTNEWQHSAGRSEVSMREATIAEQGTELFAESDNFVYSHRKRECPGAYYKITRGN